MKIAMISEHASPLATLGGVDSGGQNVYVSQLAHYLASLGHDVDVYTRQDNKDQKEVVKLRDNLQVVHVPAGPAEYIRKEDLFPYMDDFITYMYGRCMRMEKPYDLIHANFWMSGFVALNLKQLLNIPFVITFHALGKVRRLHQKNDEFPEIRLEIEETIMKEASRIIAECPQDKFDMIELYNADIGKIAMIPCGFDPQEFAVIPKIYARRKVGLAIHEKIVLQLGRIVPRKGVETAIRGFAEFYKNEPQSRLIIVGGEQGKLDARTHSEVERLKKIAHELEVGERVQFLGHINRSLLKYYYSAADVFVTTPWYEPFGITPLEAMACGTPVVGSDVGGIKYTVKHGITGFLIPPKDPQALKESLSEVFKSPRRHAFMSKQAVQRVYQFSWNKIAQAVNGLYQEVCAPHVYTNSVSR